MSEEQLNLFDAERAEGARDASIKKVDEAAEPDWKAAAELAIAETAAELPDGFIVDDVWRRIPADVEPPHEGRAIGALMLRASKAGVIVATETFRPSERVKSHRTPRRVWVAP